MDNKIKNTLIYGLMLASLYCCNNDIKKEKSVFLKNKIENKTQYKIENPSSIGNYVRFSREDSTLIREDSLEARIFLSVSVRRRQDSYDSINVHVDNVFSRSYVNGREITLDPITQDKQDYLANLKLFNLRYGHIMYNINDDLSNKFYSLPKDSTYAIKKESVKIDYNDYLNKK